MIYRIWRDGLHIVPAALGCLKATAAAFLLAIFLNAAIFIGEYAYAVRNSCDKSRPYPLAINTRGDRAEGIIETCTLIGTVANYYVTLQIHIYPRFYATKTLIGYSPVGDRDPILRWADDSTLTVNLGRVYWVSPHIERVDDIRVIYNYTLIDQNEK